MANLRRHRYRVDVEACNRLNSTDCEKRSYEVQARNFDSAASQGKRMLRRRLSRGYRITKVLVFEGPEAIGVGEGE